MCCWFRFLSNHALLSVYLDDTKLLSHRTVENLPPCRFRDIGEYAHCYTSQVLKSTKEEKGQKVILFIARLSGSYCWIFVWLTGKYL